MIKTMMHGEFKYCSKSHSWQVISAVLDIISWFPCTIFYDDSMYRKKKVSFYDIFEIGGKYIQATLQDMS